MAAAEIPKTNDSEVNLHFFADNSSDDDDDDEKMNANDKKINKYLKFNISTVCTPIVFHPPEHTTRRDYTPSNRSVMYFSWHGWLTYRYLSTPIQPPRSQTHRLASLPVKISSLMFHENKKIVS